MDEQGKTHSTLVKAMIHTDNPPRAITNGNVDNIGSSELEALSAKCDEVGIVREIVQDGF